jgi:hypothetical protein
MTTMRLPLRFRFIDKRWYLALMILITPIGLTIPNGGWILTLLLWLDWWTRIRLLRRMRNEHSTRLRMVETEKWVS